MYSLMGSPLHGSNGHVSRAYIFDARTQKLGNQLQATKDRTVIQILDKETQDYLEREHEFGLFSRRRVSWPYEEDRGEQDGSVSGYETPSPALPVEPSIGSPGVSHSPAVKRNLRQSRSVLDLETSPQASARSALSNYELLNSSLGPNSVLDVCDSFLSEDRHSIDSSAQLLPMVEDSSRWGPPSNSRDSPSQQNSELWMDTPLEDFADNEYGHLEDGSFITKISSVDRRTVFYPSSPGVDSAVSVCGYRRCKHVKPESDLVIQILDEEAQDCSERELESGLFSRRRVSWPNLEENRGELDENVSGNETPPALPVEPSLSSSAIGSKVVSQLPDIKRNLPEPRSVLDLTTSPRASARSALSNYELHSSVGPKSVLDVCDSFLNEDFYRIDSSAHLLPIVEDSSRWEPPSNSRDGPSQQNSELWMETFVEDFGVTSTQTSLPGLETEGEEARTNSIDTPTSTPSVGHKSGASDQEQSEEEGNEEAIAERSLPPEQATSELTKKKPHREVGLELINLLLACAEAVATKSLSLVNPLFAQLGKLASPEGTSMQRVAAYYTEGLATRCSRIWPQMYQPLPYNLDLSEEDSLSAFHILNHVCPYIKFSHFTANEIILQAFEHCDRVHVIDFDIKQGLQWPALFQSLASRPGGPPSHVRVTGIGDCKEDVQDTGDRLAEFAEELDLQFEFHAVIDKLEDVRLWMLHVKEQEVVAVNCLLQLHRTLHDAENGIKDMLGLIMSTKPKVVAVVEQEANHNGPFLDGRSPRVLESLEYYAAIFDSLDMNMPADSIARMKVEQFFAREIRNIIACEGPERVERHETFDKWSQHLIRGGFQSVPLSRRAKSQAELLLEMFACKSYTLTEDGGALTLGWRNRPLFTASAWIPKCQAPRLTS